MLGTPGWEYVLLSPETVLTKICMLSSDSEADELMLEMLDVRRMVAGGVEVLRRWAVLCCRSTMAVVAMTLQVLITEIKRAVGRWKVAVRRAGLGELRLGESCAVGGPGSVTYK